MNVFVRGFQSYSSRIDRFDGSGVRFETAWDGSYRRRRAKFIRKIKAFGMTHVLNSFHTQARPPFCTR